MSLTTTLRIGALLAAVAVLLGAFAAHGLRGRLDPAMLEVFQTGARYQMIHAIALIVSAMMARSRGLDRAPLASWLFLAGIVLFSGSLFALSLSGIGLFGAITPFGGLAFVAGWLALWPLARGD